MSHYLGIPLWTEVRCSECNNTTAGEYVWHGRRQMRKVMAELDRQGWENVNGVAVCPKCQKRIMK